MDGWKDVYTDPDGKKRCSRCHHVRPLQPPEDLSNATRHELNDDTRNQRVMEMQRKTTQALLEGRRQALAQQPPPVEALL